MGGRLRGTLVLCACLVLLAGGFLWALPEIGRQVALKQIPKLTGRAAAIDDIDLNLFTGRVAIKGFRLAERGSTDAFVEFQRLDLKLSLPALLRFHVRLVELALARPTVRVVRTGPTDFNFSDLIPPPQAAPAETRPSRWALTLDRLRVTDGRIVGDDRAVAPAAEWLIAGLGVEADGITTRAGAVPGRLSVRARINEAALAVTADSLRLEPLRVAARLSFEGFEMRRLDPYVYIPLKTPYMPQGGRLTVVLTSNVDSDPSEVKVAGLSGTIEVADLAVAPTGGQEPFLTTSRVRIAIKAADALSRTLTVAGVDLEGVDLKVRRDAQGVIDLVQMFTPKTAPSAAAASTPSAAPPEAAGTPPQGQRRLFPVLRALARGFDQILVERITLAPSAAAFVDEAVKPTTTLALTKLQARIDDFTWPPKGPAAVTLSSALPGGGTVSAKGAVIARPFVADVALALRDAPVTPYQAYIPVPARLSGRYGGDSQNHVEIRDGQLVALSKGNSWGQNVEIRAPGSERPIIRVERMDLVGIDFDWPRRASLAKAAFRRPRVDIERAADGSFNVRRLFTPVGEKPAAPGAPTKTQPTTAVAPAKAQSPAARQGEPAKGLLETMQLDFREARVEEGVIRFLDRTTTPAFSQDLSRLGVTLTDLGNRPNRRAKLVVQSVVGGDAALDIRGEIGPIGAPAFVDLVGELRSFKLPSVDPYAASTIGWVVKTGELQYKVRFKLEGDQITAHNDMVVGKLQVAPASGGDEVKRRIGLPLGLIVALVKDQQGDIRANIPVTGDVNDPQFDLSDTIWTAVKNVLVNIVTAPFKAIGRLFSGGDKDKLEEPKVDAVAFAAGSSVISPAMEDHLLRVADFLRRTPFVNLSLTAVSSPADVEALKGEAVNARLKEFQREQKLSDGAVLAAYYKERMPRIKPPETTEARLAHLRAQEPAPDALLADLSRRRVEGIRQRLVAAEGIPPARLTVGEAPDAPRELAAEGRVEFAIAAGG